VINRTLEHAQELAATLGGMAAAFEDRREQMIDADIVISSTACPQIVLSREDAESIAHARAERPLILIDIAMPRDIAPDVRGVTGVFLFDLDDLEKVVAHNSVEREKAALDAQKIAEEEAQGFRRKLLSERVVPTIVALRNRLNEICRQELDSFKEECGPFCREQDALFDELNNRVTRKIAGALARELREHPEKAEQDQLTNAVELLFHLQKPEKATAGTTH
jgi:glutamyl-tRNA reductase